MEIRVWSHDKMVTQYPPTGGVQSSLLNWKSGHRSSLFTFLNREIARTPISVTDVTSGSRDLMLIHSVSVKRWRAEPAQTPQPKHLTPHHLPQMKVRRCQLTVDVIALSRAALAAVKFLAGLGPPTGRARASSGASSTSEKPLLSLVRTSIRL